MLTFFSQIFDFVNVQSVHNATFLQEIPPTFPAQAYGFANFHEAGVFTDSSPDGIGNSASLPSVPSLPPTSAHASPPVHSRATT